MNNVKQAVTRVKSTVNDDEMYNEYVGEYAYENGVHNIAYGIFG